jgi:hypothetical protein
MWKGTEVSVISIYWHICTMQSNMRLNVHKQATQYSMSGRMYLFVYIVRTPTNTQQTGNMIKYYITTPKQMRTGKYK